LVQALKPPTKKEEEEEVKPHTAMLPGSDAQYVGDGSQHGGGESSHTVARSGESPRTGSELPHSNEPKCAGEGTPECTDARNRETGQECAGNITLTLAANPSATSFSKRLAGETTDAVPTCKRSRIEPQTWRERERERERRHRGEREREERRGEESGEERRESGESEERERERRG
jgi:hypothetical protein